LRRAIRDNQRNPKLIDILDGRHLTDKPESFTVRPTYLHDAGAAQKAAGFDTFLERFLGFQLPSVPTTSGGETKLYLQAIFAALAVEQKRGWTDYIANIPFFGIRDARTRVVEYLLALDVFKTNAARNHLNTDSVAIAMSWDAAHQSLQRKLNDIGAVVQGVPLKVSALFDPSQVVLQKQVGNEFVSLPTYVGVLRTDYERLSQKAGSSDNAPAAGAQTELEITTRELYRLTNLFETASATSALQRGTVMEYAQLLSEAAGDLARNKTALKLRNLGASNFDVELASGRCPTCHQPVEDSLLTEMAPGPQMDLETNISYLEKQARMLERQIAGSHKVVRETEALLKELSRRIDEGRAKLNALRSDVASDATESRAVVRQQIQIEIEIDQLQKAELEVVNMVQQLSAVAARLKDNQASRTKLPKDYYSDEDRHKIRIFEKLFRANASAFEYESAPIQDIRINDDALVPFLANIELREIGAAGAKGRVAADIKADSSASDFIRLILSYLLALHQASSLPGGGGRHPGILLLDEPGQHSMGQSSQRALLQQIASSQALQGIVAASFDESPEVFREVTQGISFTLVDLSEKSIGPLATAT
jgi:hypothetical protein